MNAGAGPATAKLDERDQIVRLRAGDNAAAAEFVRAHTPRALGVARRLLRNDDDAREVVQEAFLSFFRGLANFRADAALSTWLHRIVVNAALMRRRSAQHRYERTADDLLPQFDETGHRQNVRPAWSRSAEELVGDAEVRALVQQKIDQLPPAYRTVIILRDIEQFETEEVAAMLDDTPGAVKTRLHRARQALRALLEEEPSLCPEK